MGQAAAVMAREDQTATSPVAEVQVPVVMKEPAEKLPAPVSDSAAIMQLIHRAATDPNVDLDKMERLLAMQERILDRNAKVAFTTALAQLQPKLPIITEKGEIKDRNGNVQSSYALWEDIIEAIRGLLSKHGFALTFKVGREGDQQTVTGILSHKDGHSEQTTLTLPLDVSGSKNAVQAVGSSVSYGKRYTAQALLNLTSKGEDDDGQKAATVKHITDGQKQLLIKLIRETKADTPKFLFYMGANSVDEILAADFNKAKTALEAKKREIENGKAAGNEQGQPK